jgi:hypothetical protein
VIARTDRQLASRLDRVRMARMVASPETRMTEMDMSKKVEELNLVRELSIDELENASGGFIWFIIAAGIMVAAAATKRC